eukprot:14345109-Alexandrium_andersonii.AAC.1
MLLLIATKRRRCGMFTSCESSGQMIWNMASWCRIMFATVRTRCRWAHRAVMSRPGPSLLPSVHAWTPGASGGQT